MAENESPFAFSSESDLPTPICKTANFDPHYDYSAEILFLEQGGLPFSNTVVPETPNLDLVGEMAENPDLGERAENPEVNVAGEADVAGEAVVDDGYAPYRGPLSIELRRFIRKELGHWFPLVLTIPLDCGFLLPHPRPLQEVDRCDDVEEETEQPNFSAAL